MALQVASVAAAAPTNDFYDPPAVSESVRPGQLIKSEPLRVGGAGLEGPLSARRIMYWSTAPGGRPIPVSGTVFSSPQPWSGRGDRPVVAIAPGTMGQGRQCAPSMFMTNVADPSTPGPVLAQYELRLAYELGQRGITVVMTDYQGLGVRTGTVHPYVNRQAQGAAVLDSVRAALALGNTGSTPRSKIGAWGYSQGGGAAAAASEMAATYAPELNVTASYAGAVPADLADTLARIDGSILSGAVGYALNGFAAVYPDVATLVDQYTNRAGKHLLAAAAHQCLPQTAAEFGGHKTTEYTTTGESLRTILTRLPAAQKALSENRLGLVRPSGAIWLDTATSDDIVPYAQAARLAASWCALGADIAFRPQELPSVAPGLGVGHLIPQNFQFEQAQSWLVDRFNGRIDGSGCPAGSARPERH